MNNNYFRSAGHTIPFVDSIPESIHDAYFLALAVDDNPVIFRPTLCPGVWDQCAVVGHRNREAILKDLATVVSPKSIRDLNEELDSLNQRFRDVGRNLPLALVA